jgi:hypothetical protein
MTTGAGGAVVSAAGIATTGAGIAVVDGLAVVPLAVVPLTGSGSGAVVVDSCTFVLMILTLGFSFTTLTFSVVVV